MEHNVAKTADPFTLKRLSSEPHKAFWSLSTRFKVSHNKAL